MTALSIANGSARAVVNVIVRLFSRVTRAFAWYAAVIADAHIYKARREGEALANRHRLRTKSDDDLPVII